VTSTTLALPIANALGVPGTAGAMVVDESDRHFLLSNHHVVFGGSATRGCSVWALAPEDEIASQPALLGRGHIGTIGRVTSAGETFFVDCALIELIDIDTYPSWLNAALAADSARACPVTAAMPGMKVTKLGAGTGLTEGIVVDIAYPDHPYIEDRIWQAPAQILIESRNRQFNFSGPGDSGALVVTERGDALGLLWGSNAAGQGIASPITPLLECLGVRLRDSLRLSVTTTHRPSALADDSRSVRPL
jgi:hypothetical protein